MDASLYRRPEKPRTMIVTRRDRVQADQPVTLPEVIEVDKDTQCHVTPTDKAGLMVDYLELEPTMPVLEPQGGTGNLVNAVLEVGHESGLITTIERHYNLADALRARLGSTGVHVLNQCFLAYASAHKDGEGFPRIITNPPFKTVQAHMRATLSLLKKGRFDSAVCVALVPVTYHHSDAVILDELPPDTFAGITVYTKLLQFFYE